ncbi:MAG TPA: Stp1/IreP family PP2C-type Ser/Thr phosphatase [Kofleriaceae bacterium]|nr:Stp1/IreP family PP2C-type Ser/Thr phosphatase [Kofleriaceae bacterium]
MKIRYAAKTDVGMKRTHNEDYFSIVEEEQLFLVADGMGGHASGEVASKMAAETLAEFFQRTRADEDATWPYRMDRSLTYVENRLACGIKLANLRIFEAAGRDRGKKGMGTTVVTALVTGDQLVVAHVGDSRGYRVRGGAVEPLTRDHSLLEDYREVKPDLTAEEERAFPHKNVITRALGMRETVGVAIRTHALQPGDVYLLCCDGLSGMVDDERIGQIVSAATSLERAATELIDAANGAGGIDNITVLLIHCIAA